MHFLKNTNPRIRPARRGSMLVLVAVVMVIFMVAAAFCVDIAYMHMVKAELRTAVDAASRAGAEELVRTQDETIAVNAAIQVAGLNRVAGNGLTLASGDVQVGEAAVGDDGKFVFSAGGTQLNSVNVVGSRDESSLDGPVGLFFGNVFGVGNFAPSSSSTSAASVRDVALVLDRSGSMNSPLAGGTRLTALIAAVNVFLDEVEQSPNTAVSLTTYSTTSTRDIALTENFAQIRSSVNSMNAGGLTNIFRGIQDGSDSLEQDPGRRAFADKFIVVMTDGNFNEGGTPIPSANVAVGRDQVIHTITFSSGANQSIMQQVATIGGGQHIHADDAGDLSDAFREIAKSLRVVLID